MFGVTQRTLHKADQAVHFAVHQCYQVIGRTLQITKKLDALSV
jgi:hypothetical protein